eukprot:7386370-Prymnesium_polylepis.2
MLLTSLTATKVPQLCHNCATTVPQLCTLSSSSSHPRSRYDPAPVRRAQHLAHVEASRSAG